MYDVGILSRCVGGRVPPPATPLDGLVTEARAESRQAKGWTCHMLESRTTERQTRHSRHAGPTCHSVTATFSYDEYCLSRPGEVGRIMSAWLKGAGSAEASEAVQWAAVGQGRSRDA